MLHLKEIFMICVAENLWAKVAQKTFRGSLSKFGQNPSQKFACSYTDDEKAPPPLLPLF